MAKMIFGSLITDFPEINNGDYKQIPISEILATLGYKFVNEDIDLKYINADDYKEEEIIPLPVNEKPKSLPIVKKEIAPVAPVVVKKEEKPLPLPEKKEIKKKDNNKVNYQISINKKSEDEHGNKEHKSIDVSVEDKPISEEMLKDILMKIESADNMTEELANKIKMAAEKYADNPLDMKLKMELLELTEQLEINASEMSKKGIQDRIQKLEKQAYKWEAELKEFSDIKDKDDIDKMTVKHLKELIELADKEIRELDKKSKEVKGFDENQPAILVDKNNNDNIIKISYEDIDILDKLHKEGLITDKYDDKTDNEYWFDSKNINKIDKIMYDIKNKEIKSFAEAWHILNEDKPNYPKYWDIYKTEKGYAVYRPNVEGSEGFAGDFNASDMDKLFTSGWMDKVKTEGIVASYEGKEEYIGYLENTYIPDLKESGKEATAEDFEDIIGFLRGKISKTESGQNKKEFIDFLENTLIPDLKISKDIYTIKDYKKGIKYLKEMDEKVDASYKITAKYFQDLATEIQDAIFNGIKKKIEDDLNGYFTEEDIKDFESGKLDKDDVISEMADHEINISNSNEEIAEMVKKYYLDINASAKSKYNKIMKEKSKEELEKELSMLKEKRVDSELETETIKDKIKVLDKLLNKPAEEIKKEEKEMKEEVKEEKELKKDGKGKTPNMEDINKKVKEESEEEEDMDEPSEQDLMAKSTKIEAHDKTIEYITVDSDGIELNKELTEYLNSKFKDKEQMGIQIENFITEWVMSKGLKVDFKGNEIKIYEPQIDIEKLKIITSADKYIMPKKEGSKYIDLREVFDTAKKAESRIKAIEKGKEYIVVHYTKYTSVEGTERKEWFEIEAKPIEVKDMDPKSTVEDTNKDIEKVKTVDMYKVDKVDMQKKPEDMTVTKLPKPSDETAKSLKKPKDETADNIEQIAVKANVTKIEANEVDVKKDLIALGMDVKDFDSHESDLYVKKTPISEEYLKNYEFKDGVTEFDNEEEPIVKNERWYDFPFANMEWWNKRMKGPQTETTQEENVNANVSSISKENIIEAKQNEVSAITEDINKLLMSFYEHDESATGKIAKVNIKAKVTELNNKVEALKKEISAETNNNSTDMLTNAPKVEAPKENVPTDNTKESAIVDPNAKTEETVNNTSDQGIALGQGFILHTDKETNELYVLDKQGTEVERVPNLIKDDVASKIEFFTKLLNISVPKTQEIKTEDGNQSQRLDKVEKKLDELLNIEKGEQDKETSEDKVSKKQNEELAALKKDIDTKSPVISKIIKNLIDTNKISVSREDMRPYVVAGEDPIFAKKKAKENKLRILNKKLWAMDNDTLKVFENVFSGNNKSNIKASKEEQNMRDILTILNG